MKRTLLSLVLLVSGWAGAQITIGTGNAVDSNVGLSTPISNWYSTSLSQFIYLASEINATGNITSLEFKLSEASALTSSNDQLDVWVGHTTRSAYNPVVSSTGADWIPVTGHTQVMANGSLTVSGTTATFTFSTPFPYNGTDNLVVTVDANEPGDDGNGPKWLQTAASGNIMSLMIRTDNAADNADPLNMPLNYTGALTATSVQAKATRPIVTLNGLSPLGIGQNDIVKFSVYPNPVQSRLNFSAGDEIAQIGVYTITGQSVAVTRLDNGLDVETLASGTYFLKGLLANGNSFVTRFVKE